MKGSVKLPVFIDDARKLVNTTQLRAKYLGATYEAEYCQWQALHGLGSLMETASLIITPNAYLEGKLLASYPPDPIGDFDVARATTATRVNSAGLVELVPYNLIRYSEDFTNGNWVKLGTSLTVTANTTIAPDGTLTADTLNVSNNDNILYQSASSGFDFTSNTYTFSIYAKGTGTFAMNVRLNSSTTTTETKTLTSEWQRFQVSVTNSVAVTSVETYLELNTSSTYFVWGAQLNEGSLKDYQKTETRLNIPRLDYSNGTCPSILVEPQRTNLALYSEDIAQTLPTNGGGTITANNTTAPNGVQTADKFTVDTSTGTHYFYNSYAVTNGQSYTTSIFLKKGTGRYFLYRILTNLNADRFGVTIDLETGTILSTNSIGTPTGTSSKIEDYGNGWYRVSLTVNGVGVLLATLLETSNTGTPTLDPFLDYSYTGNGTDTYYLWGMQVEVGSYATSYIPTQGASVTRNADVISKTGISSLIGQTEGTLFVEFYNYANNSTQQGTPMQISASGFYTDAIYFEQYLGNWYCAVWNGGNQQFLASAGTLSEGWHKLAVAYKTNDIAYYVDGNLIATDTSATIPTCSQVYLGINGLSAFPEQMGIKASALWKTRLTNTQLAQLTTI